MRTWNRLREMVMALTVVFYLGGVVIPAMTMYTDTPIVQKTQTVQTTGEQDAEDDDVVLMIFSGGLLLIILSIVIAAASTMSAAVAVAADMDVDGD